MTRFLYQIHIMWYELEMVPDTLDSFYRAQQLSNIPVDVAVCFNKQTYLEQPIDDFNDKFDMLAQHPALQSATIVEKTDRDLFYNVGDWRREVRTKDGYTIWGESDTLVPYPYFLLLEQIWNVREQLNIPHVVSLASRKMWDNSWESVEHPNIRGHNIYSNGKSDAPYPLGHDHTITQEELDNFNANYMEDVGLTIVNPPKIDGSMLALHPDVPQIIADDISMVSEDYCAQMALTILGIPQYHLSNIIKGHNYHRPDKRTNTIATRNEFGEVIRGGEKFNQLAAKSSVAMERFLRGLMNE